MLLLRASVLLLGALLLLGLLLREASLLLPEESLQLSLQLGLVLREKSLLQGSLLREDGLGGVHGRTAVRGAEALAREHRHAVRRVGGRVKQDAISGLDAVLAREVRREPRDRAQELAAGHVHARRVRADLLGQARERAVVAAAA